MSFQNLTHSQVNAASLSPPILPRSPLSCPLEHTEEEENPQEVKSTKENTNFSSRDEAGGFYSRKKKPTGTRAPLSAGKGGSTFFFLFFFNHKKIEKKMNRSFNRSQPLRTVDCNAVEVKSKVSVEGFGIWK